MLQVVEVSQFKLIIEDFDNLFLKKTYKTESEALDLLENLIGGIIFLVKPTIGYLT